MHARFNWWFGLWIGLALPALADVEFNLPAAEPTIPEDQPLIFSGSNALSLTGPSSATEVFLTLSSRHGQIALEETSGLAFTEGTSEGASLMKFSGISSAINTALKTLRYIPPENYGGSDTIGLSAVAGSDGVTLQTLNLTVTSVNDPPTFSLAKPSLDFAKGTSGAQQAIDWVNDVSPGPEDETAQQITFTASVEEDPDGVLAASPSASEQVFKVNLSGNSGTAWVSVVATDTGGRASNGQDQSEPVILLVTVAHGMTLSVAPSQLSESATEAENPQPAAQGVLQREGPTDEAVVVSLLAGRPGQLDLPDTVEIPAGESRVAFDVYTVDDREPEAPMEVSITALASGYERAEYAVEVRDYDEATIGKLAPEEVGLLTEAEIQQLDAERVKTLEDADLSKILTNVDAANVTPETFSGKLPENWQVDPQTGKIEAPAGARLTLPVMEAPLLPPAPEGTVGEIELTPERINLKAGFSVGGRISEQVPTEEAQLNEALASEGLGDIALEQDAYGIVQAKGENALSGFRLAILPDFDQVTQQAADAREGLGTTEGGQFTLTTPAKRAYVFVGAPQDPLLMAQSLRVGQTATESEEVTARPPNVKLGKSGDVLIEYPQADDETAEKRRAGGRIHQVVQFDPVITPVPAETPPGLRISEAENTPSQMVFTNQTAQQVFPGVRFPHIFLSESRQFPGVENILHRNDGGFLLTFMGAKLLLRPTFDTQSRVLDRGERLVPKITLDEDGTVAYTVRDGDFAITSKLLILPPPPL